MSILAMALLAAQPSEVVQPLKDESGDQYPTYWENAYWEVWTSRKNQHCSAGVYNKSGDWIAIGYDAKLKTVSLFFTDKNSTSLKDGDTRKISIVFVGGRDYVDDGWGEREFTVGRSDEFDSVSFFIGGMDNEMLSDIAKYDIVGFLYNDKLVTGFGLKGSAEAIKQLRSCALERAGINPNDVFAQ